MSFFDEADEPRRPPRGAPRPRRPSGRGRPPGHHQAIQTRRAVAVVVLIVLIVLIAIGVHSCDVSARNSSLRDYTNSVSSLIQRSNDTGTELFRELSSGTGSSNPTGLQTQIDQTLGSTQNEFAQAQNLSVPGEMQTAQQALLMALKMRRDGTRVIARQIQPALGTTTNKDAVNQIAGAMAHFYASDVLYKSYAAPAIASALNAAGIPVGGVNGPSINGGQFLPALGWLQQSYIATRLGVHLPGTPSQPAPTLTGVAVGTNTMVPGVTNHVQHSPPPTFTITVTNNTHSTQFGIGCSISLAGSSDTGTGTITELPAGQTGTCNVTLPTSPTPGLVNVTASVTGAPGGQSNTLTFPVQFL